MSDKEKKEVDFEKLKFIRVFTTIHVPKELIEQIRHRNFSVDKWFENVEESCTVVVDGKRALNPLNFLYVIADERNKVVGVLWCVINPLENALVIMTFSIDKAYWMKGKAVQLLDRQAKELVEAVKLDRVFWITNYPKHSERYGYKRSKQILLEWIKGENNGRVSNGNNGVDVDSEQAAAAGVECDDRGRLAASAAVLPEHAAAL